MSNNHNKIDLTFAKRLEQIMIERNVYPAQLSKITGIKRTVIYSYVSGTHQPSAFNIKRIAIGLGVSADWLLGITDNKKIVQQIGQNIV